MTALRAAAETERDEWRASAMADATGHMFRCAKVNGVWACAQGCAVAQVAALAERVLKDYDADAGTYCCISADTLAALRRVREAPGGVGDE